MTKNLPFTKKQIEELASTHPTPFYVYDEAGIRNTAREFNGAFSWVEGGGFRNYFAVKALPNPNIVDILSQEGMGADCSSLAELEIAKRVGIDGERIMFTSNNTPAEEFQYARKLGAVINLDDIAHIEFLERSVEIPELICFRYNPGDLIAGGNTIIGRGSQQKFGLTTEQIFEAYKVMRNKGVKRFGLHTMLVSNQLVADNLLANYKLVFETIVNLSKETGIRLEFANLGGGIGIPYGPNELPVDLKYVSDGVKDHYEKTINANGLGPIRIVMECGRAITGPHGYLVSEVRHVSNKYKNFVGLDASIANLMRHALYGSYHHITVLGKEDLPKDTIYDVTGSLCENNDRLATNRLLPKIDSGDIFVFHDAGAHGHSMGGNYNGKLRSAEFLRKPNGEFQLIRRAETLDDYFSTLPGFNRRNPQRNIVL